MTLTAKPAHQIAFHEMQQLQKRMADEHGLTGLELLAVAANMLGKLIALQDQRCVSPAMALAVCQKNIQIGNDQAVAELRDGKPAGNA